MHLVGWAALAKGLLDPVPQSAMHPSTKSVVLVHYDSWGMMLRKDLVLRYLEPGAVVPQALTQCRGLEGSYVD